MFYYLIVILQMAVKMQTICTVFIFRAEHFSVPDLPSSLVKCSFHVRFQVLTAASMMFRIVFWDIPEVTHSSLMMEAARTSETSVDNHFTRQYIPEDNSELHTSRRENLKSHSRPDDGGSTYL
jgi:hypothetical protein